MPYLMGTPSGSTRFHTLDLDPVRQQDIVAAGDTNDVTLQPLVANAAPGVIFPLVVMIDRETGDRRWARTYDGAGMYVKRVAFKPDGSKIAAFVGF
jgi:hypothetical protein